MQSYTGVIVNNTGAPQGGISVSVYNNPAATLAIIYGSNSLSSAIANPILTPNSGEYTFYAPTGRYNITASAPSSGGVPFSIPDILLYDPADNRSGTTAQRPVPYFVGQEYLDLTLGFPITALQIAPAIWINSAGAQV